MRMLSACWVDTSKKHSSQRVWAQPSCLQPTCPRRNPPESKLHVGREPTPSCSPPHPLELEHSRSSLNTDHPGSLMDPGGEKELPETRKEECRSPVFLDIATLFLATSSQRKVVGRFCMHRRVCILGREGVYSRRAERASAQAAGIASLPRADSSANTSVRRGRRSQHAFS